MFFLIRREKMYPHPALFTYEFPFVVPSKLKKKCLCFKIHRSNSSLDNHSFQLLLRCVFSMMSNCGLKLFIHYDSSPSNYWSSSFIFLAHKDSTRSLIVDLVILITSTFHLENDPIFRHPNFPTYIFRQYFPGSHQFFPCKGVIITFSIFPTSLAMKKSILPLILI